MVLRESVSLFLFGAGERPLASHRLLIAGFGCEICGVYLVVLLLGHGVAFEKLCVAVVIGLGVFHPHACFVDAGVRHRDALSCGIDA